MNENLNHREENPEQVIHPAEPPLGGQGGLPSLDFAAATERIKQVVNKTPLVYNHHLSKKHNCNIFLKREDLQTVRSYKIRGAYNMLSSLPPEKAGLRGGLRQCRQSCTGLCTFLQKTKY